MSEFHQFVHYLGAMAMLVDEEVDMAFRKAED